MRAVLYCEFIFTLILFSPSSPYFARSSIHFGLQEYVRHALLPL